jgi:hypothetical protein
MVVRARAGALLVLLGTLLGACGAFEQSGYQFVRSPSTGTYLKVPDDWEVFNRREISDALEKQGNGPAAAFPFLTVFDAGRPANAFLDLTGPAPKGFVRVRDLEPGERDVTSFSTIREELFKELNAGAAAGAVEVRSAQEVKSGPARGQRVVFVITDDETGDRYVVDQVSLVDLDANRVHFVAVACSLACFDRHEDEIDEVVGSLTIKER